MRTKSSALRFLPVIAALGLAAFVYAGPAPGFWQSAKPITTFAAAKTVGPNDTVTMQCKGCKTVMIRDSKHVGPPSKGREEWFAVGSKHTCEECKGEITVAKGKTADSMQHNCSKCGDGAVTCCVAPAVEPKK